MITEDNLGKVCQIALKLSGNSVAVQHYMSSEYFCLTMDLLSIEQKLKIVDSLRLQGLMNVHAAYSAGQKRLMLF